jgi:hypothetical protein
MANAGWKSAETFHRFYNKPVENSKLANVVLKI